MFFTANTSYAYFRQHLSAEASFIQTMRRSCGVPDCKAGLPQPWTTKSGPVPVWKSYFIRQTHPKLRLTSGAESEDGGGAGAGAAASSASAAAPRASPRPSVGAGSPRGSESAPPRASPRTLRGRRVSSGGPSRHPRLHAGPASGAETAEESGWALLLLWGGAQSWKGRKLVSSRVYVNSENTEIDFFKSIS